MTTPPHCKWLIRLRNRRRAERRMRRWTKCANALRRRRPAPDFRRPVAHQWGRANGANRARCPGPTEASALDVLGHLPHRIACDTILPGPTRLERVAPFRGAAKSARLRSDSHWIAWHAKKPSLEQDWSTPDIFEGLRRHRPVAHGKGQEYFESVAMTSGRSSDRRQPTPPFIANN
jgi:hypothetical protein